MDTGLVNAQRRWLGLRSIKSLCHLKEALFCSLHSPTTRASKRVPVLNGLSHVSYSLPFGAWFTRSLERLVFKTGSFPDATPVV